MIKHSGMLGLILYPWTMSALRIKIYAILNINSLCFSVGIKNSKPLYTSNEKIMCRGQKKHAPLYWYNYCYGHCSYTLHELCNYISIMASPTLHRTANSWKSIKPWTISLKWKTCSTTSTGLQVSSWRQLLFP